SEPPSKLPHISDDPPVAGPSTLPSTSPNPDGQPSESEGYYDDKGIFVEPFPLRMAGIPIGLKRRDQVDLRKYLELCGPLGEPDLFETAEILMTTGLISRGRTKHLKGPLYKGKTPWRSDASLLKAIDKLPRGPKWKTASISAGKGRFKRTCLLYYRDILEVIRELIGARRFKDVMHYAPERHWTSDRRTHRIYDEMWSGDWWWRMQGPPAPLRDREKALEALRQYQTHKRSTNLKALRLKALPAFWENIPGLDIGACLTPDLLHQLYKGLFEHAKNWVEALLGTDEFNRRFQSMPPAQDLRYFGKGVTRVKVWLGRESREMMRQFLPVVIDAQAPVDFICMIRALLDFSYLAQAPQLTDTDLEKMEEALKLFHQSKEVLVPLGIVLEQKTFDRIAKIHMLSHYVDSTRELGTPDG
ncbi:hypothetical protein FRC11_011727, partial [Ceratobasidium sp. 423]